MGTGNFPFFKNSPSVLAAQLWSLEVQNILPRNLRQWTLPSGRQGLSPCSGVSGSHSQIPESQEQVGLSILMLQNIPEGRSPEWVFFFFPKRETGLSGGLLWASQVGCLSTLRQCLV